MRRSLAKGILVQGMLGLSLAAIAAAASADTGKPAGTDALLPTGQRITPLAAPGSHMIALDPAREDLPGLTLGWASNAALSPDRTRLAVITAGINGLSNAKGLPANATAAGDFILIYDVTGATPRRVATLTIPSSYGGLAWSADGQRLFAALGAADAVQAFALKDGNWANDGAAIKLGHKEGIGIGIRPLAAGIALVDGGRKLAVANRMNDSLSVVNLASGEAREIDLRPGHGRTGGTDPYWIAATGGTLWVTSQRDRELIEVDWASGKVGRRVALKGVPNRVIADRAGRRLFVAEDNADLVEIIDARTGRVTGAVATLPAGPHRPRGATPNALALSADERTLYVTNGGANALAVIRLAPAPRLAGLIPTGWYPAAVAAVPGRLIVLDTKGQAGPNRGWCAQVTRFKQQGDCAREGVGRASNQYILQLVRSNLLTIPTPNAATLARLTPRALANARIGATVKASDAATMAALRQRIRHVIYIVKENRSYDQVLGDLPRGNGDPRIAQFGRAITPNQHALAENFVTLDDFRVSGEVSGDGWQWSTAARGTDVNEQLVHTYYAGKGGSYDSEGTERGVVVQARGAKARRETNPAHPDDDDVLAGPRNAAEIDGPEDERGLGYLWDAAARAGKSVRNYGFFLDLSRYDDPADKGGLPPMEDAFAANMPVAIVANDFLKTRTDPFFRGFDNKLPDFYRFREWQREFDAFQTKGDLPNLSFVRLMNDHMGAFNQALRGVNTPETQQADNDYAVGQLVEAVAHSRFAKDTLIFVLEDDAQDGPDHVDAHRSIAFVAGPYVRQGAVVSTRYTTVDMIRTIEAVLGLTPNNLFDGGARPMAELFDLSQKAEWSFKAVPADVLYSTQLPLPPRTAAGPIAQPRHDAAWWAERTKGFDWTAEDKNDAARFNAALAEGLGGE